MSDDITSIIQGAVTEAEGGDVDSGGDDGDLGDTSGDTVAATDDGTDAPEPDVEGDAGGDVSADEGAVAVTTAKPTQDDIDKELEALGIKPPVEGQRENRIPYNRVRKIVENSRKRLTEQHTTALKGVSEKLTTAEKTIGMFDRVAATDPDALMAHLVKTHPGKYDKFMKPGAAAPVEDALAGMPPPDYVFDDGSLGYTMEGNRKVQEWTIATAVKKAVTDAEASMTKRFGSIEQRETVAAQRAAMQPRIDAQIAHATEVWGPLFTDDYNKANSGESEILNYMQAHPGMAFEACAAAVLTPKLRQSETEIRAKVFKEMNGRKAAAKLVPAARTAPDESTEDQDTADIIREAIAGLK